MSIFKKKFLHTLITSFCRAHLALLLLVSLGFSSIHTFAEEELPDYYAGKKKITYNIRENYPITHAPIATFSNVNLITGDYVEDETDLVVAGVIPISLRRFYNHLAPHENHFGGWRYNPESYLAANFELENQPKFLSIGNRNGQIFLCDPDGPNHYFISPEKVTNGCTPPDLIGAEHHLSNTDIFYQKIHDSKNGARYSWKGTITDGSGTVRSFNSAMHEWSSSIKSSSRSKTSFGPNSWTPYLIPITQERLPNGNILCYTYTNFSKNRLYPQYPILKTITAYNSTKTKRLGSLTFNYQQIDGNISDFAVTGSDGRKAFFTYSIEDVSRLHSVKAPGRGEIIYNYGPYLSNISKQDRQEHIEYDPETHKIAAIYETSGNAGELRLVNRFEYNVDEKKTTKVIDEKGNSTLYRFDKQNHVTALEKYLPEEVIPYVAERYSWNENNDMISKSIEKFDGSIVSQLEYTYDENHNIVEEKYNDNLDNYTIERTYSNDGFNLVLTEYDGFKKVAYSYVPGTNLVASEFIIDDAEMINKRTFNTYDDCAICVRKVVDDGKSENVEDISEITYRTITYIYPKQSNPCYGLPEIVEEKTLNQEGAEILVHKVKYTYHPSGQILREDHFDANNRYAYSTSKTYDSEERVITEVDATGNRITRQYDNTGNLVALIGPRPDMLKRWCYDQAHHPIQEIERQSDGTPLTTTKSYDESGQLIQSIDACGNATTYGYDSLGRLVSTTYPDEAQEELAYDYSGNIIRQTNANGGTTYTSYNHRHQPTKIIYPDGSKESFQYHSNGEIRTHISRDGSRIIYTYDICGNCTQKKIFAINDSFLKKTSSIYSPFCELSTTDSAGVTTEYTYDFAGRKLTETVGESTISYEYNSLGRVASTQKGDALYLQKHDFLNRIVETSTQDLEENTLTSSSYSYDSAGNCTNVTSGITTTSTQYNTRGEPTQIKQSEGHITTIIYGYEPTGRIKLTTDPLGVKTLQTYDSRGRELVKTIFNADGDTLHKEAKSYDLCGNLVSLTRDVYEGTAFLYPIRYEWEYDSSNRMTQSSVEGQFKVLYAYNNKGRVRTITKPDGTHLHHIYDDLGRLIRFYSNTRDIDYSYNYNHIDQITSVQDRSKNMTTTRTYDIYGNLTQETLGNNFTLANTYDPFGKRVTLTLPDQSDISYTYQGDFLHQITRKENTYTYDKRDESGNPTTIILPGELGHINIARTPLGQWEQYSTPYFDEVYPPGAYDPAGRLISYTYTDPLGEVEMTYAYDELGHLVAENDSTYTYDSISNRLSKGDENYTINPPSQITAYTYDPNGNLLSDGEKTYQYDSLDRLVTTSYGKIDVRFTYDPFNRYLSKQVYENKVLTDYDYYLWDNDQEIGSTVQARRIVELRILGDYVDSNLTSIAHEFNGNTYIPIHDHTGSVVTLVNLDTTETAETFRYTAFGEELLTSTLTPWRFGNQRYFAEVDLFNNGRDCYSPRLGRTLSQRRSIHTLPTIESLAQFPTPT
ncbi:MAG: putative deoxyribonuclease RhsA, partial [Chlamydiae bacterium]|nr:putative deoxyribonuclease RhsA [Chlamydiota bacterium]